MNKKKVILLGGGISGLAAAHRLSELMRPEEIEIAIVEARDRVGGVVETYSKDGFLMEAGPDAFLCERPWALDLCKRLGLERELLPTHESHRRSAIYWNHKLHPLPRGFYLIAPSRTQSIWKMDLLSFKGKVRMACESWIPPRAQNGDESVGRFIERRFGREALARIGQPMIGGIYTGDAEALSLEATLPRFREMEERFGSVLKGLRARARQHFDRLSAVPSGVEGQHESEIASAAGPRYGLFLSLKDGMQALVDALVRKMPQVLIKVSRRVRSLERGEFWKVHLENGETLEADALCLALPAFESARLLEPLDLETARDLSHMEYESVATVNLAFRKEELPEAPGFGFVVPPSEQKSFIACAFSSIKFKGRAPQEAVLLRVFVGGAFQRRMLERDDKSLIEAVVGDLSEILGTRARPLLTFVRRFPKSMPQYRVGHLGLVKKIEEGLKKQKGIFLTGNAYGGVGLPDCVRHAEQTARKICESFEKK